MTFDKKLYWENKPNNVGSRRPKAFILPNPGKHLVESMGKLININRMSARFKPADIRNTKKHRDMRTNDRVRTYGFQPKVKVNE